jgi:hypothetical protein
MEQEKGLKAPSFFGMLLSGILLCRVSILYTVNHFITAERRMADGRKKAKRD